MKEWIDTLFLAFILSLPWFVAALLMWIRERSEK